MGMKTTHHVADNLRRFLERGVGVELQLLHHMQQAAVNRLQTIAHIGQRPVHDGGKRIGEITLLQRILEFNAFGVFRRLRRGHVLAHDSARV